MHAHATFRDPRPMTIVSSVHGNGAMGDGEAPVAIRHHSQGALLLAPPREQQEVEEEVEEEVEVEQPAPPPRPPRKPTMYSLYSIGPPPPIPAATTATTTTTTTKRVTRKRRRMVAAPRDAGPVVGKVHFVLPPLRDPWPPQQQQTRSQNGGADHHDGDHDGAEGTGPAEASPSSGTELGDIVVSTVLEVVASPYFGRQRLRPQSADNSNGGDMYFSVPAHGPTKITRVEVYAGRTLVGAWVKGMSESLPADRDFKLHFGSYIYGEGEGQKLAGNPQGLGVTLTVEFSGEDDGEEGLLVSSVALVQTIGPVVDAV